MTDGELGLLNSIWMTGPQVSMPHEGGGSEIGVGAALVRQQPMPDSSEDCSRQTHGSECVYTQVGNHAGLVAGRQAVKTSVTSSNDYPARVAEAEMSTHVTLYEHHSFVQQDEAGLAATIKDSRCAVLSQQAPLQEDKENQISQPPSRPSRLSLPHMTPFQPQGIPQSVFDAASTLQSFRGQQQNLGSSGVPFRYQLRRPVESWKYVEVY